MAREFENPSWTILFAFSEDEFFQPDIDVANFLVSHHPPSGGLFWDDVVAVDRFTLDEKQSSIADELAKTAVRNGIMKMDTRGAGSKTAWQGKHIMSKGIVKRHLNEDKEVICITKNEGERIRALRDIFGIALNDKDAEYIQGRIAALP